MNPLTRLSKFLVSLAALVFFCGAAGPALAASAEEQRSEIRKMRQDTLTQLYKVHPAARANIRKAAGYAVFSNVGINLIFLSAAGGSGVAHDNRSGKDIYMKMVSGGIGIGLGVKDFRGIFVFSNRKAFRQFVDSGWEASAQADAAAKSGGQGRRGGRRDHRGARRRAVPAHQERSCLAGDHPGHQILQERRPELGQTADRT